MLNRRLGRISQLMYISKVALLSLALTFQHLVDLTWQNRLLFVLLAASIQIGFTAVMAIEDRELREVLDTFKERTLGKLLVYLTEFGLLVVYFLHAPLFGSRTAYFEALLIVWVLLLISLAAVPKTSHK